MWCWVVGWYGGSVVSKQLVANPSIICMVRWLVVGVCLVGGTLNSMAAAEAASSSTWVPATADPCHLVLCAVSSAAPPAPYPPLGHSPNLPSGTLPPNRTSQPRAWMPARPPLSCPPCVPLSTPGVPWVSKINQSMRGLVWDFVVGLGYSCQH